MLTTTPHYLVFETEKGHCALAWADRGISRFQLPLDSHEAALRSLLRRVPDAQPGDAPEEVLAAVTAIKRYFRGEPVDLSSLSVDLGQQDELFSRIYALARQVGWGRTTSYGALARQAGRGPEAARDVGQAMARNPVPLIIPCHRVLAAGGKIGGFSAPGGSETKRWMLELEGVGVEPPRPVQQSLGL